jgi:hypothetical protein
LKCYAGIGSRRTTPYIEIEIRELAERLAMDKWTVRSGGAPGCDTAFEQGADAGCGQKQIFLPWKGFNGNKSFLYDAPREAYSIASKFHPAWNMLKPAVQRLMARNVMQVLGLDCRDPVECIICYTPDGCEDGRATTPGTGGTGQALRIATFFDIPIYNLAHRDKDDIYNIITKGHI